MQRLLPTKSRHLSRINSYDEASPIRYRCLCLAFIASAVPAQDIPAATRGGILQVGGAFSIGKPDYFDNSITGITGYATFDLNQHLGAEVDIHILTLSTPRDIGEQSYMIGPRYVYRVHERYMPYGKVLFGIGKTIAEAPYIATVTNGKPSFLGVPGTYGAYGFGGGLDINISRVLTVRAIDFEYQKWPGFPKNGLSPSIISFGVAYRIR